MVNLDRVFFLVVASYDQPVYADMIRMRRAQFERRNIPHLFVLDGPRPDTLKDDEIYFRRTAEMEATAGPKLEKRLAGLLLKFQSATKGFLTDPAYTSFTHVLRINVSTFINIDVFEALLQEAPERGCYVGTWLFEAADPNPAFLSGTAILFSRDVLEYFASLDLDQHPIAREQSDDIALGGLLAPHFPPSDLFPMIIVPEEGWERVPEHPFIRVRNEGGNRDVEDSEHWRRLMRMFEDWGDGEEAFVCERSSFRRTMLYVFATIVILVSLYLARPHLVRWRSW